MTMDFFQKLYEGISAQTSLFSCAVIGGNLSGGSDQLIIDITVIGEIKAGSLISRNTARPGDQIYVTGMLGNGSGGFDLLKRHNLDYPVKFKEIVDNYLIPTPRLHAGVILAESGYATSMIDISDGLSSDIGHICHQSNVIDHYTTLELFLYYQSNFFVYPESHCIRDV